jgi:DNA replication protein DnaC
MNSRNDIERYFFSKANEFLAERENRKFEFDDDNKYVVDFFLSYFFNHEKLENFGGDFRKGIFLYGSYGTGKSLFFEILEYLYQKNQKPSLRVKTVNTIRLVDEYRSELSRLGQLASHDQTIYQRMEKGPIHFEDLGAEKKINHYGNQTEVMSDILQLRYSRLFKTKCKTFITSNLTPEQVRKRYGERIYDRMFQMFNFLELNGKSRRK